MKTEDISFQGKDPGAVKHGNFINYYSFHSAKERIDHLHHNMFLKPTAGSPHICLDIGCNTGELTQELYKYMKALYPENDIYVLGIDIDPGLIERAKEQNCNSNISFAAKNILDDTDQLYIFEFLKQHNKVKYDVTFCFSVTMWIHINSGDDGLIKFLEYLTAKSNSIVLEPQPWNCYRNAQRRLKKVGYTFPLYEKLQIRSNVDTVIEEIITKSTHKKVYESPHSTWNRKVISFHSILS